MSQVGCLMKHQAYGDNFCHWLFYKTGNCRAASVITVFKQRDCVYLLMYPVSEQHSQKGHTGSPRSTPWNFLYRFHFSHQESCILNKWTLLWAHRLWNNSVELLSDIKKNLKKNIYMVCVHTRLCCERNSS